MNAAVRRTDDSRTFRNEDLVLAVKPHDPAMLFSEDGGTTWRLATT